MDEKVDKAIENVLGMIRPNTKSDDTLKFSQSVLNLAQTRQLLISKK